MSVRDPAAPAWLREAARARLESPPPADLAALAALAEEPGGVHGEGARAALRRLARGEAVSVGAGQQPGLLGGPALILSKAATAVAAAERLTAGGTPAVAVFWIASEDADFEEAARAWWLRQDGRMERAQIAPAAHRPGLMVGHLEIAAAREAMEPALDPDQAFGGDLERVRAMWERAADSSRDFGGMSCAFLAEAFGARLVVVDSRAAALRRAARPVFHAYLERRAAVAAALDQRAAGLRAEGREPVLDQAAREWGLFETGASARIRLEGEERESRARELADRDPPALSPNVVLRPLVEDAVFPHVGRVVGPSEARYHEEIAPAYALLGRTRPPLISRLGATLVPPEAESLAAAAGMALEKVCGDVDAAIRAAAGRRASELPPARELARLRASWGEALAALRDAAGEEGREGSFAQRLDRAERKVDYEIGRLEEGLEEMGRAALLSQAPRLRHLKELLMPRGRRQERSLSASAYLAAAGADAAHRLVELAARDLEALAAGEERHSLLPLEGGRT